MSLPASSSAVAAPAVTVVSGSAAAPTAPPAPPAPSKQPVTTKPVLNEAAALKKQSSQLEREWETVQTAIPAKDAAELLMVCLPFALPLPFPCFVLCANFFVLRRRNQSIVSAIRWW